jgi:formyltetrahydrofolate deformylase
LKETRPPSVDQFRAAFEVTALRFDMEWEIRDADKPARVLIMVSKYDHCLRDLLYRRSTGELNIEITAVVSNHEDLRNLAEREGVPYIHCR